MYNEENEPSTFQLARRLTYWHFDTSSTNSYNGQGNCAEVLDPECIRQLEEQNRTALTGDFSPVQAYPPVGVAGVSVSMLKA